MAKDVPPPSTLERLLQPERLGDYLTGAVLVLAGWLIARLLARVFEGAMAPRLTAHQLVVWRRIIHHGVLVLFAMAALREMGFNLSVLLGAAGVLTVAVGFASQTSASNLISGIFLIGEGSFGIGDYIRVGQTEGEVLSIDLLSVKLCTAENLFVRIPNEQIIRSEVTNYTRFPIRRLSLSFAVAWHEDVARVRGLLLRVVQEHPACLDEPAAQVIMQEFADEAVTLQLLVWTRRQNVLVLRDQLQESVKDAFAGAGVSLPPRVALPAVAGRPGS